jgi:DNA-binding NarL/FixJ family response regulator
MHRGTQVLLVGPYQLYLDCLAAAFDATGRFGTVSQASRPEEVLQKLREKPPDLLVLDVKISTLVGVEWIEQVTSKASLSRLLILGSRTDEKELVDWIIKSAEGVHYKESSLAECLRGVEQLMGGEALYPKQLIPSLRSRLAANNGADPADSDGSPSLTQREREILDLLLECLSNKQIASRLHLSRHTVKNHVHNILKKRGVADRLELIKQAQQMTREALANPR